ncbi:hypothetical protein E2542_SST20125 [Spatholobus suberectus]|nr:hypothetical protein E2542_SST20125 [Spatholobus suberectus]
MRDDLARRRSMEYESYYSIVKIFSKEMSHMRGSTKPSGSSSPFVGRCFSVPKSSDTPSLRLRPHHRLLPPRCHHCTADAVIRTTTARIAVNRCAYASRGKLALSPPCRRRALDAFPLSVAAL